MKTIKVPVYACSTPQFPRARNLGYFRQLQLTLALMLAIASSFPLISPAQTCAPNPSGLVSCWKAENNVLDNAGANNGTLVGSVTYVPGEVGRAFSFNGNGSAVTVGNPANLQSQIFTIEGWVQRASTTSVNQSGQDALLFSHGNLGYGFGLSKGSGDLFLSVIGQSAVSVSAGLTDTNWHHVAVTKNGSTVIFYIDGVAYPAASYNVTFAFYDSAAIGARGDDLSGGFYGSIDELSVYSRALAASEVQAIYNAGGAGKCGTGLPVITVGPTSKAVAVGNNIIFNVVADGLPPLGFQWQFNGTNLSGATTYSLALTNVQFSQAGNYAVVVSNALGPVTSSNAVLTVNPAVCVTPPSGLLGWWPGEGDASDPANGNNGTLHGGLGFASGKVGQAFSFNGNGQGVSLGSPSAFQLQNFTIDAWIQRGSINQASLSAGGGIIFSYGTGGYGFALLDIGQIVLSQIDASSVGSSVQITDTNWHHVAVTKNGTAVVFYVDGVGYPTTCSSTFFFGTEAAIGARGDNFGNTFLGLIDEVDVFNRALSAPEVQSIYNASNAGKCNSFPPMIAGQPVNETVGTGNTATFSVGTAGTEPLSYQWKFNNTNISGATASTLTLADAQSVNAGNYTVTVTNSFGSATSSNASLTVAALSCTLPPAGLVGWWQGEGNTANAIGGNYGTIVLGVNYVSGAAGLAFGFNGSGQGINVGNSTALQLQNFTIDAWIQRGSTTQASLSFGGGIIFGYGRLGYGFGLADNGQLFLSQVGIDQVTSSVTITNTGWHHVAVTKSAGTVVFYVDGVAYPAANYNTTFAFTTSAAIGLRGDTYGGSFLGALDEVDVFNRALAASEIQTIYNAASAGKCLSSPPSITAQPLSQTTYALNNVSFNVGATSASPLLYQWFFDGQSLSGATNPVLSLTNLQTTASGNYWVVVSNAFGFATSQTAVLTVLPNLPPVITIQPQPRIYMPLDVVALSVAATGAPPLSYQWYKDGALFGPQRSPVLQGNQYNGMTSPTLNFPQFTPDDVGSYYVVVSNVAGSVTSSNAVLSMIPNTVVYFQDFVSGTTMQFANGAQLQGASILFPPQSSATTPLLDVHNGGMVAFYFGIPRNNSAQPGGTFGFGGYGVGANYTQPFGSTLYYGPQFVEMDIPPSSTNSGSFSFGFGSEIESNESMAWFAQLLIASFVPPVIITPPQSQTAVAGQSATFSVVAEGDHSMTYQWQFNGTNLAGATGSTLNLPAVSIDQAGIYSVAITNSLGYTNSPPAALTVLAYSLSATISGGNLSVQWPTAASGFILESTTSLTPPVTWSTVTNTPATNGQNNVLSLPTTNGAAYYRLHHP